MEAGRMGGGVEEDWMGMDESREERWEARSWRVGGEGEVSIVISLKEQVVGGTE